MIKRCFKICLMAISTLSFVTNSYAIFQQSNITNINFGEIVQTADTTVLTMDTNGNVTATGGIKSGNSTYGIIGLKSNASARSYDRIENTLEAPSSEQSLGSGCTASLSEGAATEGRLEFTLVDDIAVQCSGYPLSRNVPVKVNLRLSGYCPAGTYQLSQSYTLDHRLCRYEWTNSCETINARCNVRTLTANVPVVFTVKSTLGISERQALDFGTIISAPSISQQVTVNPDGTRSGGVFADSLGKNQQGIFNLVGAANTDVKINMDNTAELSNGSGNTITASLQADRTTIQLDSNGNETLNVGGTLNVAANQPSGEYTGTYTVRISY